MPRLTTRLATRITPLFLPRALFGALSRLPSQQANQLLSRLLSRFSAALLPLLLTLPRFAAAQGFEKVNTTVTNVNSILVVVSVAVVTIAIIWAGFKMIFQGSRLSDVANILLGGTLVGGASAFAAFIVN